MLTIRQDCVSHPNCQCQPDAATAVARTQFRTLGNRHSLANGHSVVSSLLAINWARYTPAPSPGMVRLWTPEPLAHGAESASYFRWRPFSKAQEQMHAGPLRSDGTPSPALAEVRHAADDVASLGDIGEPVKHAALVFSYEAESG